MSKTKPLSDPSPSVIKKPLRRVSASKQQTRRDRDVSSNKGDTEAGGNPMIRSLAQGAAVVGIPGALAWIYPGVASDAAILTVTQIAADWTLDHKRGRPYTLKSAVESSLLATAMTVPLHDMFGIINTCFPMNTALDYFVKAAVWGGIAYPVYIATYQFFDYLIKNRTLEGFGAYLGRYFVPVVKTSLFTIYPLSLFNIFLAPPAAQIPITAALCYGLALFGNPKPNTSQEEQNDGPADRKAHSRSSLITKIQSTCQACGARLRAWGRTGLQWAKRIMRNRTTAPTRTN